MAYSPAVQEAIERGLISVRKPEPATKRARHREARDIALDELARRFASRAHSLRNCGSPLAQDVITWCLAQVTELRNAYRRD